MRGFISLDEQGAASIACALSGAVENILASCPTDELKQQAAILLKNAIYNCAGFLNTQTLELLWNSRDANMITIADNLHFIALTLTGNREALPNADQFAAEDLAFAFPILDNIFWEKFPRAHAILQQPNMIPLRN